MKDSLKRTLSFLLVCVFFCILSFWILGFYTFSPSEEYLGQNIGELQGWIWRFWWVKKLIASAWASGASLGYMCRLISIAGSYPETGNLFDLICLSWPLESLFGAPLYFNIKALLIFSLNGISGYLLGRALFKEKYSALVCGAVMSISPYCLSELENGRIRQTILFPMLFYCRAMIGLCKAPSLGRSAAAGIWAGLTSIMYLFYGMSILIFTLLFILSLLIFYSYNRLSCKHFIFFAVAGFVALIMSLPSGLAYLSILYRGDPLPELVVFKAFPPLSDLLGSEHTAVVQQNDPLLNSFQRFRFDSQPWQYPFVINYFRNFPVPFTAVSLAAVPLIILTGLISKRKSSGESGQNSEKNDKKSKNIIMTELAKVFPWALGGLLFYLLTLGPYIKDITLDYINQESGGVPNIYLLFFKYFPAFSRLFSPVRMSGMFTVCAGVLAGFSFEKLGFFIKKKSFVWICAAAVVLLACVNLNVCLIRPVSACRFFTADYYKKLAKEPGDFSIFEVPIRTGDYIQYNQITHGKRLIFGWATGAIPPGYPKCDLSSLTRVDLDLPENTFLQFIERLNADPEADIIFDYNDYKRMIDEIKVRYLIVHERGCYIINQNTDNGDYSEFYNQYCETMKVLFGNPVASDYEYVQDYDNSLKKYRMSVFRIDKLSIE